MKNQTQIRRKNHVPGRRSQSHSRHQAKSRTLSEKSLRQWIKRNGSPFARLLKDTLLDDFSATTAGGFCGRGEETNDELFFVAEAMRHAHRIQREQSSNETSSFLLGMFSCLHPHHPARAAIGRACVETQRTRRTVLLERIQIGRYEPIAAG
jgi:hypothetical protein